MCLLTQRKEKKKFDRGLCLLKKKTFSLITKNEEHNKMDVAKAKEPSKYSTFDDFEKCLRMSGQHHSQAPSGPKWYTDRKERTQQKAEALKKARLYVQASPGAADAISGK